MPIANVSVGVRYACLMASMLFISTGAIAEDQCRDVFLRDLGNKQAVSTSQESGLALFHAKCVKQSAASNDGSSTSLGGKYDDVGVNFGQSGSNSSTSSASDCGQDSADSHFSASLYFAQSVYKDVVEAWKTCMIKRETLACWPERDADPTLPLRQCSPIC